MTETNKIDRKLPPHELNARRNRKRSVTKLPAIVHLPDAPKSRVVHHSHKAKPSGNDQVYNPATNPVNDSKA